MLGQICALTQRRNKWQGHNLHHALLISLPQNQAVKTATIKLRYHFSPGLIPAISHLKVSLNGTLFATLAVTTAAANDASIQAVRDKGIRWLIELQRRIQSEPRIGSEKIHGSH